MFGQIGGLGGLGGIPARTRMPTSELVYSDDMLTNKFNDKMAQFGYWLDALSAREAPQAPGAPGVREVTLGGGYTPGAPGGDGVRGITLDSSPYTPPPANTSPYLTSGELIAARDKFESGWQDMLAQRNENRDRQQAAYNIMAGHGQTNGLIPSGYSSPQWGTMDYHRAPGGAGVNSVTLDPNQAGTPGAVGGPGVMGASVGSPNVSTGVYQSAGAGRYQPQPFAGPYMQQWNL